MNQIHPYKTVDEALISLDNGGRFYNLLTKAEDGTITQAELAKVGGVFNEQQKMILFLELSLSHLDSQSKDEVLARLDDNLKEAYTKYVPKSMSPAEINQSGILSTNLIVTGTPEWKESRDYFSGMVLVPVGKAFVPIPVSDLYHVYEIRDEHSSENIIVAHSKSSQKLPEKKMTFGGVLKELKPEKNEEKEVERFFEINYFMNVE